MGEPLAVWRHVAVTERRTMVNFPWLGRLFRARVHQHAQRQPDQDPPGPGLVGLPALLRADSGLLKQELGHANFEDVK